MTTLWTLPTLINQYAESGAETAHIQWNDAQFDAVLSPGAQAITTNGALLHLARSPKVDFKNKTYYLTATGFNFNNVPEVISGIEVRLNTNRRGRVTDETIQLLVNNTPVGDNQATLSVDPIKTYGGPTNLWGLKSLSNNDINSSFGVLIRFQSHPHYPHKDGANIYSVELVIY
jgi:hypothetical protein